MDQQVETQQSEQKKVSKIDQKRQQIFMDRFRRKLGEKNKDGSPKTEQQAIQEIQREDYDNLPIEKKLSRLENIFSNTVQAISEDIMALKHNDRAVADAFDINYRMVEKLFMKLGVSDADREAIHKEALAEVQALRQKQHEERLAAQKKAQDEAEKAQMEAEAKEAEAKVVQPQEGQAEAVDPHVQEGATVFGSEG